jgi:hypothetical protein
MISGDFYDRQFFGHKFMAQNIQLRPGFLITKKRMRKRERDELEGIL